MTHPDDELSILGWMRRLVRAGAEVHVGWTHAIPVREAEARAVMSEVGVPPANLVFFDGVDGGICDQLPELLPSFRAWLDRVRPDFAACGAFEQGHLDHDGTHWLLGQAFAGPRFEIPFYHTYVTRLQRFNRFADPSGEFILEMDPEERAWKKRMARMYRSQRIWSLLVMYELGWTAVGRRPRLLWTERMRPVTAVDYRVPNLPAPLREKVERTARWRRWKAAMERIERETTPPSG